MFPHTHRALRTTCIGILMALVTASSLKGQTLTGELEAIDHPAYAGTASQFRVTDAQFGGERVYDGELIIFCADLAATSLDEDIVNYPYTLTNSNSSLSVGSIAEFAVWDRYNTPQDEALATAQAHWLVDNYYVSYVAEAPEDEAHERQYAFQNVVWEIFGDGGTAAGLDFSTGNIDRDKFEPGRRSGAPELWAEMNSLLDAVKNSGVTAGYQARFEVFGVLDSRDGYQDYLAISTSPEIYSVPEPSTALLVIAGGLLAFRRRRRRR